MKKKKRLSLILVIIIVLFLIYSFTRMDFSYQDEDKLDKREVKLYFSTKNAMYLKAESRMIEKEDLYIKTLQELSRGPESSELGKTIPEGVTILGIKVEDGLARVDFNQALVDNHWGGSTGESLTVYSIVNTMTQFEEIDRVLILISGEKIETLAGHMYLMEALDSNEDIIENGEVNG